MDSQEIPDHETLHAWLEGFVQDRAEESSLTPWIARLPAEEQARMRRDLALVLAEPESTGEPLDWREIGDILREYAELAGWSGPPVQRAVPSPTAFRVDVRAQEIRALKRASPAVQRVANDLLTGFLAQNPTDPKRLEAGNLKKMANRGIWQIDLPDGYRLRYHVDASKRMVYVVYLGPHPDGQADGRERTVRATIQRRRKDVGTTET